MTDVSSNTSQAFASMTCQASLSTTEVTILAGGAFIFDWAYQGMRFSAKLDTASRRLHGSYLWEESRGIDHERRRHRDPFEHLALQRGEHQVVYAILVI